MQRSIRLAAGAATASLLAPPAHAAGIAAPVPLAAEAGEDRQRAVDCMTAAIAYEAGHEPLAGQQAVGEVILNRLRAGAGAHTVCGVVFAGAERTIGCQFTFTCDGSLARHLSERTMAAARAVAEQVIAGAAPDRIFGATHYHADYVSPYWAPSLIRVAKLGAHIFYRLPSAFAAPVAAAYVPRGEPAIVALARVFGERHLSPPPAIAASPAPVFAPWGLATRN